MVRIVLYFYHKSHVPCICHVPIQRIGLTTRRSNVYMCTFYILYMFGYDQINYKYYIWLYQVTMINYYYMTIGEAGLGLLMRTGPLYTRLLTVYSRPIYSLLCSSHWTCFRNAYRRKARLKKQKSVSALSMIIAAKYKSFLTVTSGTIDITIQAMTFLTGNEERSCERIV